MFVKIFRLDKRIIKKFIVYLLSLYFLYPFHIENNIGNAIKIIYVSLPILVCAIKHKFVFKWFSRIIKNGYIKMSLLVLMLSLLYASLLCIFSGDFSFVLECYCKPVWKFARFIFIYLLVVDTYGKKDTFHNYIKVLTEVTGIYVIATLYMMINHSFMRYWLSLVQPDVQILYNWQDFARVGLMGRTNADTSMLISLIFVGVCIDKKLHYTKEFFYTISIILMLIGNFLYGRLGLFFSLVTFLFFGGTQVIKKYSANKIVKIIFICIFSILVAGVYGSHVDNDILQYTVNLAIEPVKALFASGTKGFSLGHSGDELRNMYFWMGMDTFLIGDGFYQTTTGSRYMQTDPALMRKILFGGIWQILLMYISASILLAAFYKKNRKIARATFQIAAIMFGSIFIFGEMKDTIYSNWFVLLLVFIISLTNDYCERSM